MTDFAIVASKRDASFAESIRAGLKSSKQSDVSISESLPQSSDAHVVVLWSAALEAGHAIDAQTLIALWSDGRLLVVRRDATPLPLGLRDLPSLGPEASANLVVDAVRDKSVDVRFMSIDVADVAKGSGMPVAAIAIALLVIVGAAGAGWYYITATERARYSILTAALEAAAKSTEELNKARQAELEAKKRAADAQGAEESAAKSHDVAALKAATDARRTADADVAVQARLVQQREADLNAKLDEAKKSKQDVAKATAAPKKMEMVAKAEAPKAEVAAKFEAPKALEAPKPQAVAKAAPEPKAEAKAPRALTRSEREANRDAEAAAKAIGKPAEQVAVLSPSVTAPSAAAAAASPAAAAPAAKASESEAEAMYQQALAMEKDGKAADAVRIYRRAARAGHGKAAKRLGDIFDRGVPGVSRDYAESLSWYQTARDLGETVEVAERREPSAASEIAAKSAPIPKAADQEIVAAAKQEPLPSSASAVPEVVKPAPPAARTAASPAAIVAAPASAPAPAPAALDAKAGDSEFARMYRQAILLERRGSAAEAVELYRRAARAGHGKAAKRLGEIFDRGVPGVSRDYAEALQWYKTARDLGETFETAASRGSSGVPEIAAKSAAPRAGEPEIVAAAKSEPSPPPTAPAVPAVVNPVPTPVESAPKSTPVIKSRAPSESVAAKAPPPAPARDMPKSAEPVSMPAPAATAPITAADSGTSFAVGIVIIAIALGIALWLWLRRAPAAVGSQQRPDGRAGAQMPADTTTLFVSYSHKDKKRVEPIVLLMEEMGRRVWMDRTDITGQAGWAGQIVRAIRECRAVVLMASPNSFSSDQVVRELYLAMNHKKTIVPIEIEPAELPDELQYILAPFQHHRLSGSETREVLGRALAAV